MRPLEELNILKQASKMVNGGPGEISFIYEAYNKLINPNANLCRTCPQVIRQTYGTLMEYYHSNKERLQEAIDNGE